ncbi:TetR/AcrR family transcriptional regulator [Bacillus sp. AP8]|uniref:TetR/AcrR family transcriptional regulator n=2 Tax=Bacillus TaxID=1386 RepID=UPI0002F3FB2E|nr:TetR/AcrR family transcriptional regulator [Bacillus sp. AP8]
MMVKKQLIMENALELFANNGIEATSIQQITKKCGISKGAFYLSYKSKNELVFGLIEYFMSEIIADIEQSVRENPKKEKLLYNFYYTTFSSYEKHSAFAKILMKEQFSSFDIELLEQLKKYDQYLNEIILNLVKTQFDKISNNMHADLVYVIKCFMKHYSELFFIYNFPIDLQALCESLVEKTTIIAEHATIPFIPNEFLSFSTNQATLTKEQISNILLEKINDITDPITQQSLQLLKVHLDEGLLPSAIIHGLLKNLRANSHSKWVAYLYELYLENPDLNS